MTDPAAEPMGTVHNLDEHRARAAVDLTKEPTPAPDSTAAPDTDTAVEVEAVDRADNPLADWLTVPDTPLLPVWARSRASIEANVKALGRLAWWHGRYHGLRVPKYLMKTMLLACRGFFRACAGLWPTLTAREHTATVRALRAQVKLRPEDIELAARHQAAHAERTQTRKWRFGIAAIGVAAAATGIALADPVMQVGMSAAIVGPLAYLGRGKETHLLDQATPPLKVGMSAQQLNDALRAAGLLKPGKGDEDGPKVSCIMGPVRDGRGWAVVFDLPRGGGKTASDVLAKREVIAQELGVDEIQVIMSRVRAAKGGNAGRVTMWVADDDPYLGTPNPSPLEKADRFSIWDPVPFGQDARGTRIDVPVMWQSMFFGGLPRRGKTFSQRLLTAAGLLDAYVRHYVADGKGGADWMPMKAVAHRLVMGAEDDAIEALKAMLAELLTEMERRFALLRDLPTSLCPEGKLTPDIVAKYNLPVIFVTIDELQEYFTAMEKDDREQVINDLCRIARRGPAAGFISNFASQRPDADSVPTKLREIITIRYSTQVVDRASSDMVLGKGKAAQGADASVLSEEHKGVGVLVTGPASYVTVRADYLDGPTFAGLCRKGRALREAAGQLTGDAAGDITAAADAAGVTVPAIVSDVLEVMRHSPRMFTTDLLNGLVNIDEDTYGDYNAETLASQLEAAGVKRTSKQVKISGSNGAGYQRRDVEAAVPAEILLSAGR
ncbi:cell division protein FtsK [Streptomyces noursei ZPM]|uniref:Cell division protein FtsK n=1 Tax=Streptomyces noursei TaxID=1971 RepID=A0A401R5G3_STRNR|nr:FtsK/SpoIIIE domain-containing protein [Streptomyces noursei]AKA05395.1 cell division protein FtsK [Streptomyces noursei ZPM]EPY93325.1 cell division protein FtsK [Streptomyces noursei CCRC 11814]EXU86839.1 cell division protein FtsK [Streptomyces noursei PD-1]UWS73790.1 cell division protein FtsK [Streptomyces noursei]GCB92875.1 cell division protein FtsK [Streptomyces noursei]